MQHDTGEARQGDTGERQSRGDLPTLCDIACRVALPDIALHDILGLSRPKGHRLAQSIRTLHLTHVVHLTHAMQQNPHELGDHVLDSYVLSYVLGERKS